MKVKTSITLSEILLHKVDENLGQSESRSSFIENAVQYYLEKKIKLARDKKDLQTINKKFKSLNREAEDVLMFQADI